MVVRVPRSSGNSSNERKKDLLCRVKYCNKLPDIPFDPKFLTYPFQPHRFVKYKHTSLEANYKHELHTETDLGLDIDLISMDCNKDPDTSNFNEVDERLLEDEIAPANDQVKSQRRGHKVSWLRRTEYISSDYRQFQNLGIGTENKVGLGARKKLLNKDIYKDRESQIEAIENTFETVNNTIPNRKNGVYPIETCPVFPDFDNWKYPFSQVVFDTKPTPIGFEQKDLVNLDKKMNNAMIRGMADDEGNQFVVYFLPTNETMAKLEADKDEIESLEYKLARMYNWTVNQDGSSKGYEEKFFIVWRDGNVYYNELGTRVKLSKRRHKGKKRNKIKLIVKPRELQENEIQQMDSRMKSLEKPEIDEEVEEDVAPEAAPPDAEESDQDFGSPKLSPDLDKNGETDKVSENQKSISSEEEDDAEDEAKNIFGSDDDDDDL